MAKSKLAMAFEQRYQMKPSEAKKAASLVTEFVADIVARGGDVMGGIDEGDGKLLLTEMSFRVLPKANVEPVVKKKSL